MKKQIGFLSKKRRQNIEILQIADHLFDEHKLDDMFLGYIGDVGYGED